MRRRIIGTLVCALALAVFTPTPAFAYYKQASCSTQPNITIYKGYNQVDYVSYTSTLWLLQKVWYNFQPSNSSSTHNNQNFRIYDGSSWSSWTNSPDNLTRDAAWHVSRSGMTYAVTRGRARLQFEDIFDVPDNPDPRCSPYTPTF